MDKMLENCIAMVLSLTTPKDACRLSLVDSIFCHDAGSYKVWEKFLPCNYKELISQAANPPDDENGPSTLKELYFWLCDHSLLLDQASKIFLLEKGSGKACCRIATKYFSMVVAPVNRPLYRASFSYRGTSWFGTVRMLGGVKKLEIRGKLRINFLSKNTNYATFLVYGKLVCGHMSTMNPMKVTEIKENTGTGITTTWRRLIDENSDNTESEDEINGHPYPRKRGDGWLEAKLSEFYNGDDGKYEDFNLDVEMTFAEKCGLVIQGIEIRPEHN